VTSVVLLTAYGDIVCCDASGKLVRRAFLAAGDDAVEVALSGPLDPNAAFIRFLDGGAPSREPAPQEITEGPLAGFSLRPGTGRNLVTIVRDGCFLQATPSHQLSHDRETIDQESCFLPVTVADRRLLRGILDQQWVLRSTLARVDPGEIRLRWPFALEIEGTGYDLRLHLPFEGQLLPYRLSLFRAGWQFDELCLYRPLIHLAAFGAQAAHRLPGVLRALATHIPDSHVLVVTERRREDVLAAAAGHDGRRLLVRTIEADEPVERSLARFLSLDAPDLLRFQPVLMLDTLILADADLTPLLAALAASDRIAAPLEPAARRRVAPFAGLSLVQQDGRDPRDLAGVDSRVIGIPNVAAHAHTLRLLRRIIANRATAGGNAPTPPWLEQEVVNYVAAVCAPFDTHLFERFIDAPGDEMRPLLRFADDSHGRGAFEAHTRRRHEAAWSSPLLEAGLEEPVGPSL
jgi:hypothetical protein